MQSERKSIAVLDANAFITMSSVVNLGATTRIFTTEDVLRELTDKKTKDFVNNLPFKITTINCDEKILGIVKDFSIKTGDIGSLSLIDMELIAITYMLYQKEGLETMLRKDPPPIYQREDLLQYADQNDISSSEYSDGEEEETKLDEIQEQKESKEQEEITAKPETEGKVDNNETAKDSEKEVKAKEDETKEAEVEDDGWITVPAKPKRKESSSSSEDDPEAGWVTSENYEKKMAQITSNFKEDIKEEEGVFNVWLVSADFALQNVAVQIGIRLMSLDGRRITSIRRFIHECYLCWKKYRIYDDKVKLCKNCGYNSLSKIAYSIDEKGYMVLHRKKGWKPNKKILEAKERKFDEQERKRKHQHARRRKKPSIFDA